MAFRFETAHERWSWYKEADQPRALEQKRLNWEYKELGDLWRTGIGAQMLQAIRQQFPETQSIHDDTLTNAIDRLLYNKAQPAGDWADSFGNSSYYEGDEQFSEVAQFAKQWLDQNGWIVDQETYDSGQHDEFPYRRKMPGQM